MDRREFLRQTAATTATLSCFPATLSAIERESVPGQIERRSLGRTGEKLSLVAFGGYVLNRSTPDQAAQWAREAYEAGVNHFDVAPEYGSAEVMLGPALEPYRKKIFLSCKTAQRREAAAAAELDRSLKRLRTDHFDLYQFHHVTMPGEVEAIFSDEGAIKAFEKARKDGKVRFLGFSAHSEEAALAMMDRFEFDSIMFPVNYATWHAGNFGPQVLAKAQQKKMGILALKAMAKRPWPRERGSLRSSQLLVRTVHRSRGGAAGIAIHAVAPGHHRPDARECNMPQARIEPGIEVHSAQCGRSGGHEAEGAGHGSPVPPPVPRVNRFSTDWSRISRGGLAEFK